MTKVKVIHYIYSTVFQTEGQFEVTGSHTALSS